jgi:hypothetical protein
MAIMFRHQSRCYRHLCRDGIMPGAVGLGLVVALNVAFFATTPSRSTLAATPSRSTLAATPSRSTPAAPPAIASATPLTAPVVTDPASQGFSVMADSGRGLGFGFLIFDWDCAAGIPGFGPLAAPTGTHAFASEPR